MSFGQFMNNNVGTFGSQGASMLYNHYEAKLQRDWSSAEAEKSRRFQNDMWEKSNAYNSPEQQMARLKEAGLNPNMMYGNSSQMAAATPMSGATASGGSAASGSGIASIFNSAQIENMRSQSAVMQEEARGKKIENDWKDELMLGQSQVLTGQAKVLESEFNINKVQALNIAKDTDLKTQQINESISTIDLNNIMKDKTYQEVKHLLVENKYIESRMREEIKEIQARRQLYGEQAVHFRASAEQIVKLLPLVLAGKATENDLNSLRKVGLKYENDKLEFDVEHMDERFKMEVKKNDSEYFKNYASGISDCVTTLTSVIKPLPLF